MRPSGPPWGPAWVEMPLEGVPPPPEVSAGRAASSELPSLSPLTESRLKEIQREQAIQSSRPTTPAGNGSSGRGSPLGHEVPGAQHGDGDEWRGSPVITRVSLSSPPSREETAEEKDLREAFELDQLLVCGVHTRHAFEQRSR